MKDMEDSRDKELELVKTRKRVSSRYNEIRREIL